LDNIFTIKELDILYDYIEDMLELFQEDPYFYNSDQKILLKKGDFIILKNKIEFIKKNSL
jgi:hypothetical protein